MSQRERKDTPAPPHTPDSLDRYIRAIDASSIVSETDAKGVITRVNDAFCDISGYSRSELLGKTHRRVNSGTHSKAFFAELWGTILSGKIWRGRLCNRAKDGSLYWVETTITPFPGPAGEPERFVSIRQDVTATVTSLQLLSASEQRFRAVFENAGVGIALIGPNGVILEASDAFCDFVGYPVEEVRSMPFTDFAAPDDPLTDQALMQSLLAGERESYEVAKRYRTKGGEDKWGLTTVSVARRLTDDHPALIGVVRDVTDVREAEDKLRRQAALAHLGEMAAVVAHEVRNPLAGILGAAQMIGRGLPPDAPEQEVIEVMCRRIGALEELVEELLVFSRPKEPVRRPMTLSALVEQVQQQLAADPRRNGTPLEVEGESLPCLGDATLLERALLNLVINAIDASPAGRPVRVVLEHDATHCRIRVLNEGPSLPEDSDRSIFEPFVSTKARGVGLGLPTTKRIVEAHGGSLELRNRPEGGVEACIELPGRQNELADFEGE